MRVYRKRGGLYEVATYAISLSNRGRLMRRDDKNDLANLANLAARRCLHCPSTLGQETTSKCRMGALSLATAKHYYANLGRPLECLDGPERFLKKKAMETGASNHNASSQCREEVALEQRGYGIYKEIMPACLIVGREMLAATVAVPAGLSSVRLEHVDPSLHFLRETERHQNGRVLTICSHRGCSPFGSRRRSF